MTCFLKTKNIITSSLFVFFFFELSGQKLEFNGQVAGWGTVNSSPGFEAGARYIPKLTWEIPAGKKFKFDGELSADIYLGYTHIQDSSAAVDLSADLYRFWLRFSGERFEIRAGLQKINFGSAQMLRPLMWFDRIDPRDPLHLTSGVYAIQEKYFFKNNANIWLWILYGNKNTKGWETIPSMYKRPEFGGRVQIPIPKGEMAFSYHNREAEFPSTWQPTGNSTFPEERFGYDIKVDLGVGLWLESAITHQKQDEISPFTRAATIGADYTFGIIDGLNITAEQMFYASSDKVFSKGDDFSFTGLSAGFPLSIITRVNAIIFYDWKNKGFYRFANLSFTFDNLALNIIGFWNPAKFSLFNYGTGPNMFAGAGGQVMIVYNY
ncbi:MAG: hypothetical protein ABSA76_06910 [Bacteroidales bacterium]